MNKPEDIFELKFKTTRLRVERLKLPGQVAYRIEFSSARQPLVIARAMGMQKEHFWTSVPEGRQQEAAGIGQMIDDYFKERN